MMKHIREYTRIEMLEWLKNHFEKLGYKVSLYSKEFLPARVALYCSKTDGGKIIEELVIEPTTDKQISIEKFFPILYLSETEIPEDPSIKIHGASPTRFYRYYFPHAKIFFAYPNYTLEDKNFNEFKFYCEEKNVGLLKTSEKSIKEISSGLSLIDEMYNLLNNAIDKNKDLKHILTDHFENILHFLVYYPDPKYQRRALIEKKPGKISQILIDKLPELKNIQYSNLLKKLSSNYREETRHDYDIVLDKVNELWKNRLGLKYPEIHMHLEEILLQNNKYRDHFIHQFQVFLIGAYILDEMLSIKPYRKAIISFEEVNKCKIEDAWLAASTYHDFNYGLQNFDDWLLKFFSETLFITYSETRERINTLNLDAAMVRESLVDIIYRLVEALDLEEDQIKLTCRFLYEKATRDRNHGVLSALSLLKLSEKQKSKIKIEDKGLLQAALAITCHDEDIWEALSGCKGYLKQNIKCEGECARKLFDNKKIAVHKQDVLAGNPSKKSLCESWERELMTESVLEKITFNSNPLIFLLIFCDTIQEEGRVTSHSLFESGNDRMSKFEIDKVEFEGFLELWANSKGKFEQYNKINEEASKFRGIFLMHGYDLTENAIIYEMSKQKNKSWKVIDKRLLFEIRSKEESKEELDEESEQKFIITANPKECYLNKINVSEKGINVELIIDGLEEKYKELLRVSSVLADKRFTVNLFERDTYLSKGVEINGNGGG